MRYFCRCRGGGGRGREGGREGGGSMTDFHYLSLYVRKCVKCHSKTTREGGKEMAAYLRDSAFDSFVRMIEII